MAVTERPEHWKRRECPEWSADLRDINPEGWESVSPDADAERTYHLQQTKLKAEAQAVEEAQREKHWEQPRSLWDALLRPVGPAQHAARALVALLLACVLLLLILGLWGKVAAYGTGAGLLTLFAGWGLRDA